MKGKDRNEQKSLGQFFFPQRKGHSMGSYQNGRQRKRFTDSSTDLCAQPIIEQGYY